SFRQPDILEIARHAGKVTVEGLARHFGVTVQTIRRDLSDMAQAGQLQRVHGGAILPSGVANIQYEERRQLNEDAKRRIAVACARDIPDDVSLFLNIGTTTEAVARALLHHHSLLVVTNNLNVATILSANPKAEVVLTGGTLRRADGGLTGTTAVSGLSQYKVDIAVLGCSAIDPEGELTDFDPEEVIVTQAALTRARHAIVVADQSKFLRNAPRRVCGLADASAVYSEKPFSDALAARCREWGTDVIVAS
ncbi:MAG: DeoR/GlpR family DNA-binding transcription regulator, partial [Pseudomonadota bacterium]